MATPENLTRRVYLFEAETRVTQDWAPAARSRGPNTVSHEGLWSFSHDPSYNNNVSHLTALRGRDLEEP